MSIQHAGICVYSELHVKRSTAARARGINIISICIIWIQYKIYECVLLFIKYSYVCVCYYKITENSEH